MLEMALEIDKRFKYVKNHESRMYLVFEKRLKYVGNDVDMWEMAKICWKWLNYLTNVLINFEINMASMCGKRPKYQRKGFTMLEMTEDFDKRLIYVGNDVYMWEMV